MRRTRSRVACWGESPGATHFTIAWPSCCASAPWARRRCARCRRATFATFTRSARATRTSPFSTCATASTAPTRCWSIPTRCRRTGRPRSTGGRRPTTAGCSSSGSRRTATKRARSTCATSTRRRIARTGSSAAASRRSRGCPTARASTTRAIPRRARCPPARRTTTAPIFLHRLGDDPENDAYVFGKGRKMTDSPGVELSPDGRWLVVSVHEGWAKNELYLRDLHDKKRRVRAAGHGRRGDLRRHGAQRRHLRPHQRRRAALQALRGRSQEARARGVERGHRRRHDVLDGVSAIGSDLVGYLLARRLVAAAALYQTGKPTERSRFPPSARRPARRAVGWRRGVLRFLVVRGAAHGLPARSQDRQVREVGSHRGAHRSRALRGRAHSRHVQGRHPGADVRHPQEGPRKDGRTPDAPHRLRRLQHQHRADASLDRRYLLLEHGGILAVANLRGGGEFGEEWHKAGMLGNKQNVFDDAIAAASSSSRAATPIRRTSA